MQFPLTALSLWLLAMAVAVTMILRALSQCIRDERLLRSSIKTDSDYDPVPSNGIVAPPGRNVWTRSRRGINETSSFPSLEK